MTTGTVLIKILTSNHKDQLSILKIQTDPFLEVGDLIATADLPETCEAWLDT